MPNAALPAALPTLSDLEENFALLGDWEERYRYLIELGGRLPPMDNALKTEETLVRGCTSRVWLVASTSEGVMRFTADSDAQIVRGLVALLVAAYQNKSVGEIAHIDIAAAFGRMGLNDHLSPNRRNGFFAMVERLHRLAA